MRLFLLRLLAFIAMWTPYLYLWWRGPLTLTITLPLLKFAAAFGSIVAAYLLWRLWRWIRRRS